MSLLRQTARRVRGAASPALRQAGRLIGPRAARSLGPPADYFHSHHIAGYIGWVRHANLGDEALFDAFVRLFEPLRLVMFETAPPLELSLYRALVKKGPAYDAVFLGGGTLILHTEYLELAHLALRKNYPLIAFGTGVADHEFRRARGADRDWHGRLREWGETLKQFRFVGVRGEDSAAALESVGVPDVRVVGDPAISACTPAPADRPASGRVAVNVGSFGPMFGSQDDVTRAVAEVVGALRDKGFEVDAFALHTADERAGQALVDSGIGVRNIWTERTSVDRFSERIGGYDLVIAQKLHGAVLALARGVPVISLAYEPKCLDFMRSVNMAELCVRTDELDAQHIASTALSLLADLGASRERAIRETNTWRDVQSRHARELLAGLGLGSSETSNHSP
ncbi:MAG: polysaccharide pyruvyl transferase family protein [Phycisphaerales bacterium]